MKKLCYRLFSISILFLVVLTSASCKSSLIEVTLEAQTFPALAHAEVNPPNAADLVTALGVAIDNGSVILTPITLTTCTLPASSTTIPCVKSTPFSVPDGNTHVAHVTFVNSFGPSVSLDLTFKATVSGQPANGTIKGGS